MPTHSDTPLSADSVPFDVESILTEAGRVFSAQGWLSMAATVDSHESFLDCVDMAIGHLEIVSRTGRAAVLAAASKNAQGGSRRRWDARSEQTD